MLYDTRIPKRRCRPLVKKAMDAQGVERERARILAQAQRLVEQGSLRDLSMRKLAAKLGITATTIYRYFTSKDELFLSLLKVGFSRMYDGMAARMAEQREARGRLQAGIEEYIRFGITEKGYYGIMFASDYPECRQYGDPREEATAQEASRISFQILGLMVEALAQCGGAEPPESRIAAVWAMLHGFVSLRNCGMLGNVAGDMEAVRQGFVRLVMSMLCPEPT